MTTKTKPATLTLNGVEYTREAYPHIYQEDGSLHTIETKPGLFKTDGEWRKPLDFKKRVIVRRPNAEVIADLEGQKVKFTDEYKARMAKIDDRIAKLRTKDTDPAVDPEVAAKAASDLLGAGWTPESLAAMEANIKAAKAALKGKTPEEIAAMTEQAMASKTAAVTYDEEEAAE